MGLLEEIGNTIKIGKENKHQNKKSAKCDDRHYEKDRSEKAKMVKTCEKNGK